MKQRWPKNNPDVCIRCATCMAICPVSRVTPRFPGPKQAGPGAERFRRPGEPSVDDWIDLCIGCHLCDMVCSAGVNISDLNLIAKAKYLDEKGRPFRDWLLTHAYRYGRLGSLFSPLINRLLRNSRIKSVVDAVLRIDRRREIPGYQFPTFRQWFKGHPSSGHKKVESHGKSPWHLLRPSVGRNPEQGPTAQSRGPRRRVAYFYGCYTNTNEVDVGKATVQVLEANGFEVTLPPQKCCGIPMLGNGDFRGAKEMGMWNVPSLLHAVHSGSDILFSSTSCGYMIKHEYGRLLNIQGSDQLAEHTFDLFDYLRNLKESGNLKNHFKEVRV